MSKETINPIEISNKYCASTPITPIASEIHSNRTAQTTSNGRSSRGTTGSATAAVGGAYRFRSMSFDGLFRDRDRLRRRDGGRRDCAFRALAHHLPIDEIHHYQGDRRRADEHVPQDIKMHQLAAWRFHHNESSDHRGDTPGNLL